MDAPRTVTLGGAPIEYVDTGGPGPVVVLLHGALMDERLWRDVVERLASAHRCVIPVLPMGGHRRAMPPDLDVSPIGQAGLVAELISAIGLDDVTLVGNDTGGAIAQLVVAHHPDRVARLVLVSCDAFENFPPGLPGRLMGLLCRIPGAMTASMMAMRIRPIRRMPISFGWLAKRPIPDEIFTRWLDAYLSDGNVRADLHRMMRRVDKADLLAAAERLPSFTGPALVVWAAEDRVMPPEHATRLAAQLPDAQVVLVDDCYTLIPLDQPERLADHITAHVRQDA